MSDRRISDSRKEQLLRVRQSFLGTEGIRDLCQSTEDHLQAVCQELGLAPPSMVCRASAETNAVCVARMMRQTLVWNSRMRGSFTGHLLTCIYSIHLFSRNQAVFSQPSIG